jgi:hypothetical protein
MVLYSWLLDHSSISRARITGRGCESSLVCAFLQHVKRLRKKCHTTNVISTTLISPIMVQEITVLTGCTTQLGSMQLCRRNELAPRRHPRLAGRQETGILQPISSEQRWQPLVTIKNKYQVMTHWHRLAG